MSLRQMTYGLLLLLAAFPAGAQTLRKPLPACDFAHFERNRIVLSSPEAYDRVFVKLDSVLYLGQGNLRILHIGGSHVQAGVFTGRLRADLLSLRPALDGGRGLVFPFSAARTNNPASFVTTHEGEWTADKNTARESAHRLGLTGMAVSTTDAKASVTLTALAREPRSGDPTFRFDRIRVLGAVQGDVQPVVVLHPGDSLEGSLAADGSGWDFRLPALCDSVRIARRGRGEWTLTGVLLDNPFPGISVTGIGVNGASLASYAKCADLERDLAAVAPDLVIFAIGVNDAVPASFSAEEFTARYKALLARVRAACPDCAFLFVSNNDTFRYVRRRGYSVNPNGEKAEQAFLSLGKEPGAGVWDLFDIMGGAGSMKQWEAAGLAKKDKVHFTDAGYELLGDLLFNALTDLYVEHLKSDR